MGEAMATAVPCVVTDVGDSAFLVGDSQSVVVPRDPAALSAATASVLDLDENARMNRSQSSARPDCPQLFFGEDDNPLRRTVRVGDRGIGLGQRHAVS